MWWCGGNVTVSVRRSSRCGEGRLIKWKKYNESVGKWDERSVVVVLWEGRCRVSSQKSVSNWAWRISLAGRRVRNHEKEQGRGC